MRVVCLLFSHPQNLFELAEIFYRYSPQIALREPDALFIEIGQCQKIYREEALFLKMQSLLKRLNLKAAIGVAEDVPTALALARFHVRDKSLLPLEALHDYLCPFEEDEDLRKDGQRIQDILQQLGLHRLVDILNLPPQSLASRFGVAGVLLLDRVKSSFHLPWPRFVPPEKVIEGLEWDQEQPCENLETIVFHLKTLIDKMMLRLLGRGERLVAFDLTFKLEKNSRLPDPHRQWTFHLALPQGSSRHILGLVRERLQFDFQRQPLLSPVMAVELRVKETAPSLRRQGDLFNPKKEQDQEDWNNLVSRLSDKLGGQNVFLAEPRQSYLPEKSWRRVLKEEKDCVRNFPSFPFPERPTRILKKPRPLHVVGERMMTPDFTWRVLSWEGPEILSGEWWDEPFERMYFKVATDSAEWLWVYRTRESPHVFLHGYFD